MNRKQCLGVLLLFPCIMCLAQNNLNNVSQRRIQQYLNSIRSRLVTSENELCVQQLIVSQEDRRVSVQLNEVLREEPLSRNDIKRILTGIKNHLPVPYNTYKLSVLCGGQPIEELVQFDPTDTTNIANRLWGNIVYKGYPWVVRQAIPYETTKGLKGRHIALWASHGRYYDQNEHTWRWQRPRIYCTTEDIFTQSFVVPYLMPMLENAGAIIYSPRERDWQRHEVVVDNDMPESHGIYREIQGINQWVSMPTGFIPKDGILKDNENPFEGGTFVMADAQEGSRQSSQIIWQPNIPACGDYAVYVSYVSLPNSIPDATYTIRHSGVSTEVKVNQKMGGRTWVYLGTYHFQAGEDMNNCVKLSNQSNYRGIVTADAVRFGGGMGQIARGDSIYPPVRSMLPRYQEGARYSAQYAGIPYKYYATKASMNDYAEDINVRSLMTNYIARGSDYLPGDSGLNVPLELSLAIHSDAGIRSDHSIIGTLGIYTTGRYTSDNKDFEGLLSEGLLPSGISRTTSRDLCNIIMSSLIRDIQRVCPKWTRRQMYDRNYSETRLPELPSMILEILSHQNWADMLLGHDPQFKFLCSRAIYKGLLTYIYQMHGKVAPVVQPLPIKAFSAMLSRDANQVELSWQSNYDPYEPTAKPDHYVLYTAIGQGDFDNGKRVQGTSVQLPSTRGKLMRFRVSAANAGGQSMLSEELCCYAPITGNGVPLLIVNGFTRVAGPQPIDNEHERGFRIDIDPGVVDRKSPCYSGRQLFFNKQDLATLGESGNEYENILVAGNTFDYPTLHASDMLSENLNLAISSCSRAVLSTKIQEYHFKIMDLILGAQRADGYSLSAEAAFTSEMKSTIKTFVQQGGSLLLSGAYFSEELSTDMDFAQQVLHAIPQGMTSIQELKNRIKGMGTTIQLYNEMNPFFFSTTRCSVLGETAGGFATMLYETNNLKASVAWQGDGQKTLIYGFPLEMITDNQLRRSMITASINYLIQ